MTDIKYAILDTDFVSKANIIRTDNGDILADRVLSFPCYAFACHEKMVDELSDNGTYPAQEWLNDKILSGAIQKYTDEDILDILYKEIGELCFFRYLSFLKMSCDAFRAGYFEDKYSNLISLTEGEFTKQEFLNVLSQCDEAIGKHMSLGEKKACVLLLTLKFLMGDCVLLFCSDDFSARQGVSNALEIPCCSILAVFMKLKSMGVSKEEAGTYYNSLYEFYHLKGQTHLKVLEFNGTYRRIKMEIMDIFDAMYSDSFLLWKNGDLLINNK